uniref:Uncharacterized protein n=1 Tax=Phlebotomus papatasi TaxID=29031 RepID=A0A1B0D324_PHLPP
MNSRQRGGESEAIGKVMKPPTVETSQTQQSTCAIKPSLSMTSLPPPNGQHESGELARLRIDRPYHSLK